MSPAGFLAAREVRAQGRTGRPPARARSGRYDTWAEILPPRRARYVKDPARVPDAQVPAGTRTSRPRPSAPQPCSSTGNASMSFCVITGSLRISSSRTASFSSGKRPNSAGSAMPASTRDSAAPGQMCGP